MKAPRVLLENILANYVYVGLMGLVVLFATPIYFGTLGPTQWGIVALCITAQGILLLLDVGLGQVMPREVARSASRHEAIATYRLFLRLYGGLAVAAFLVGQLLVPMVASGVVSARSAPTSDVETALRLVLLQFLFQFPNNAAVGYWNGLEQQKRANVRLAFFAGLKHVGALTLVLFWRPTADAYMLPFVVFSAVEWLVNYRDIRAKRDSVTAAAREARSDFSIKQTLASVGGFGVAVALGMLVSQIDRIYLANAVSTEKFGTYVLVTNLALALMHLQSPVQRAFSPRIMAGQSPEQVLARLIATVAIVCVLPCLLIAWRAEDVLLLWLKNSEIATEGALVFRLVAIAVALNAVYSAVYTLYLRWNKFGQVIVLNASILAGQLVMLALLTERFSILAGGMAWLLCGAAQVAYGSATLVAVYRR